LSDSGIVERWKREVKRLRIETYALYLAYRDPRVPWYAKAVAAIVVGYAFSPIDLVPDFIPVLGYLDDLVLVPLGIALALRLIPAHVLDEYRDESRSLMESGGPKSRAAAAGIIAVWVLTVALSAALAVRLFRS
jgi:uncharacterized membrane protein YkvA (DUF1232 family)